MPGEGADVGEIAGLFDLEFQDFHVAGIQQFRGVQDVGDSRDVVLLDGVGIRGLGVGGEAAFVEGSWLGDDKIMLKLIGILKDQGDQFSSFDGDVQDVIFQALLGFDVYNLMRLGSGFTFDAPILSAP